MFQLIMHTMKKNLLLLAILIPFLIKPFLMDTLSVDAKLLKEVTHDERIAV